MIDNLTYKQKLKALGIITVLIMLISYRLAFSKTIEQYSIYKKQVQLNSTLNNGGASLENLVLKERKMTTFLNQFILDTTHNEKNFLFVCSEFCNANRIKIKEYNPGKVKGEGYPKTITNSITVEGSFINILQLINYLETQKKTGYLISANYKSAFNYENKNIKLSCIIYLQNLLLNNHEN